MATGEKNEKKRISFRIIMPSVAFSQFLRKVVYDENHYNLFLENSEKVLRSHGVKLAEPLSNKAFADLRFTIREIHDYVTSARIPPGDSGQVFGIVDVGPPVLYSEYSTESNRGVSTHFEPDTQAVTSSSTDHEHTTSFSGIEGGARGIVCLFRLRCARSDVAEEVARSFTAVQHF